MTNYRDLFISQLVTELGEAYYGGVGLKTPVTVSKMPAELSNPLNFKIPQSISDLYAQFSGIRIIWEIVEREENTKQFKEDPFLIETYFKNGYAWGVVKDFLSGSINITSSTDIFDPAFNTTQAHYYVLMRNPENGDNFYAFDIQNGLTACFKLVEGEIIDNVWIINTDSGKVYNMNIDAKTYLELAYKAKGIYHWQFEYLSKNNKQYQGVIKTLLPKIFKNINLDLSDF